MTSKTALAASAAPRSLFYAPSTAHMMLRGPQVAYSPDEGAPLSVAQAMEALREPDQPLEPEAVEAAPDGELPAETEAEELPTESEPEPTGDEDLDPEAVIEGDEAAVEPESDPETVIAAPQSWDAKERALFKTLPPAAQEIILTRETERDRAVSKAQQESTQARKTAEADLAGLAQYKATFDQIATKAEKVFADKWSNVDWLTWAAQDPAAYTLGKAQFDAEQGELQQVQQAKQAAERVQQETEKLQFQTYVQGEYAKLAEIAPELADPVKGPARRTEITQVLLAKGFEPERVRGISAEEMAFVNDALKYRALVAKGQTIAARPAAPQTRPTPAPARSAAPSAAPTVRPTRTRNADTALARLSEKGSVDNAIAALQALRGAR